MKNSFLRTLLTAAVTLSLLAGCGYHAPRSAMKGAGGATTIDIAIFTNKSYRPNIETVLTDLLIDRFEREEGMKIVEGGGELHLSGAILTYATAAVSYSAIDTVKEYRATVTAEATLRKSATGQVVWKGQLTAYQDFPANDDLGLQQNSEEAAIREITRKLAQDIYFHFLEDF